MKKLLLIPITLFIGIFLSFFISTFVYASGEIYVYSDSSSANGLGGFEITGASGAYNSKVVFKKINSDEAKKYSATVNGYSIYYTSDSISVTSGGSDPRSQPTTCTTRGFIALKSEGANEGIVYSVAKSQRGSVTINNLCGVVEKNITISADVVTTSVTKAYATALSPYLNSVKQIYYESLGSRAPCSSQGCNDTQWNNMVGACWQTARNSATSATRNAAEAAARSNQPFNSDEYSNTYTKKIFSDCLSDKTSIQAKIISDSIAGVDVAAINKAGGDASASAREEENAILSPDSTTDEATSTCVVEGVGWIICPITNFLSGIADASFGLITNFLEVNSSLYNRESATYNAWVVFRNVANIGFVIVFLIAIISQLSGQGMSNYGVKKTLPRLIVAAVLVNISFFVCQLVVDLSQILGFGIKQVMESIPVSSGNVSPPSWGEYMGDVLAGTAIGITAVVSSAAIAAIVGLSIGLPALLAVLIAILMTVLILIGRQAAIVILIILSPIAFVAYMLPNTEKFFKLWFKAFLTLLMVFPIVSLLYGGGALASKLLSAVAASSSTDLDMKFWLGITALVVAALPLIMTPTLLKTSLNGLGTVGAKLSGFATKANGRVGRTAMTSSRLGDAKQGIQNRFALGRAKRRATSKFQQRIDNSPLGKAIGLDKGSARATRALFKADEEEVDAAVADLTLRTNSVERIGVAQTELKAAIKAGDKVKARAAQKILLSSGTKGLDKLQEVYDGDDMQSTFTAASIDKDGPLGSTMSELRSDLNSAGLKGRNNALARFGYEGSHSSFRGLRDDSATLSGLNPVELAGQSMSNLGRSADQISPESAQAVLDSQDAYGMLDDKKRAVFTARAQGFQYTPPQDSTPQRPRQTPPNTQTPQP